MGAVRETQMFGLGRGVMEAAWQLVSSVSIFCL